nr:MAG TPA: hypothetical protein [Caudoviricetes sp.]
MADLRLRINELPEELNPAPIDNIAIDGPTTRRTTLQRAADAVRPYSTEAMAREGLNNASVMTPLRVSQAIETLGGQRFATAQQGNKADTAVQPTLTIAAGTGLTGGGTLAANREIALSSTSIASLARADSAVQPTRQLIAGVGLTGGGSLAADRTISLDAATQASLGRADSAIQAPGGTAGQILAKASSDPNDVNWVNIEAASAVSYGPQSLTTEQKAQARTNIDAFANPTGTTAQYVQGDGTLQAKTGLPVSSATQTALDAKANTAGPTLTGTTTIDALRVGRGTTPGKVLLNNTNGVYIGEIGVGTGTGDGSKIGFFNSVNGGWWFNGAVQITGTISKGGGTFLIDHPLDPLNKNLRHGFVEAPEYLNVYRGVARLQNGRVTVNIDEHFGMTPGTFWALNTDITVSSLQNQEGFARVRPEAGLTSGLLEIVCEDDGCNDLIAWAVTGRRRDAFVLHLDGNCESATGRFIPEFSKPDYSEIDNG